MCRALQLFGRWGLHAVTCPQTLLKARGSSRSAFPRGIWRARSAFRTAQKIVYGRVTGKTFLQIMRPARLS